MTAAESAAWCPCVAVVKEFLRKTKADNYQNLVELMLSNLQLLRTRMGMKVHYLFSHLDGFSEILGDLIDRGTK